MIKIKLRPLLLGTITCFVVAYLQYADYRYITSNDGSIQLGSEFERIFGYFFYFIIFIMSIMLISYGLSLKIKFSEYGENIYTKIYILLKKTNYNSK